jgi:hypothetical protein
MEPRTFDRIVGRSPLLHCQMLKIGMMNDGGTAMIVGLSF